ncbi:MAG: Adenylate cyclase [Chlamydiales bacterium]|jgi:class 3 adenylate cyclase/predicted Zn-ribbon and HTH transcriptional regulator|nr:Adenylate cyclase [Chlamydiales bacterium]
MQLEGRKFHWEWTTKASIESVWDALIGKESGKRQGLPFTEGACFLKEDMQDIVLKALPAWPVKSRTRNWIAGRFFSSLTAFESGPISRMLQEITLVEEADGVKVTHEIQVESSGLFSAVSVPYWIGYKLSNFLKAFYGKLSSREMRAIDFGATLSLEKQSLLRLRAQALVSEHFRAVWIKQLLTFLLEASDRQVRRMSPFYLARLWGVPAKRLLDLFLAATRQRLLEMSWLIRCPTCGECSLSFKELSSIKSQMNCPLCKGEVPVDPQSNLELVFAPHPSIRSCQNQDFEDCSQIIFLKELDIGQSVMSLVQIPGGRYRASMVGDKLSSAVVFSIDDAKKTSLSLEMEEGSVHSFLDPLLKAGHVRVSNRTKLKKTLKIENLEREDLATRGRTVFNSAYFRKYFPEQVLAPLEHFKLSHVVLLFLEVVGFGNISLKRGDLVSYELFRDLSFFMEETVASFGGALVHASQGRFLFSFESGIDTLKGAATLHEKLKSFNVSRGESDQVGLKMSLHNGSCIIASLSRDFDYCGQAPSIVRGLLDHCQENQLVFSAPFLKLAKVASYLEAMKWPQEALQVKLYGRSEALSAYLIHLEAAPLAAVSSLA